MSEKKEQNYVIIEFGWSSSYILPFEDGMKLLEGFQHAFQLDKDNNGEHKIIDMKEGPKVTLLSGAQFKKMQMLELLTGSAEE